MSLGSHCDRIAPTAWFYGRASVQRERGPKSGRTGIWMGVPVLSQQGLAMGHTSIPEPPGFSRLSKAEQLRYLQALWDRVAQSPGELPVPESHIELAEERLADYRRDPTKARPAHDILKRLGKKSR